MEEGKYTQEVKLFHIVQIEANTRKKKHIYQFFEIFYWIKAKLLRYLSSGWGGKELQEDLSQKT